MDRIELDDCLISQEINWIITGASIILFALITFILSIVVLKLIKSRKPQNVPYGRISNNPEKKSPQALSSTNGQRTSAYKNTSSPFEDVNF